MVTYILEASADSPDEQDQRWVELERQEVPEGSPAMFFDLTAGRSLDSGDGWQRFRIRREDAGSPEPVEYQVGNPEEDA